MKKILILLLVNIVMPGKDSLAQDMPESKKYWQIGIGLGELPFGGSFKPSLTFGYHFNEKLYSGIIYQFKDEIQRNKSSFNAQASGLDGLSKSYETVAQRFLFQVRYTPVKNGPYLSTGFVFNGKDSENMEFDSRKRIIGDHEYEGELIIQQSRPAGWGFALGIGYSYRFKNNLSAGFEWTPAWFQYAKPEYSFAGNSTLSESDAAQLIDKMNKKYKSSVTNLYKVFHIGLAYQFH